MAKAPKHRVDRRRIGGRIVELREQRRLSQQEVADQAGIGAPQLCRYEVGTAVPGQIDTIIALADVLDVSVDYLLFGRGATVSNGRIAKRLWKLDQLTGAQLDALAAIVDGLHGGGAPPKGARVTSAPGGGGKARGVKQAGAQAPRRAGASAARDVTEAQLLREVARAPGSRMEQLAKTLGVPSSKEIAPVMKALIAAKKVKTQGQARGTTYRPA